VKVWAERSYPYIVGALAGVVCLLSRRFSVLDARQSAKIFDDVVGISAVGLGFWSTAATLLLAVEHKSLVRKLKKGPHFRLMIGYIFAAISWLGLILMLTLVGIFLGDRITVRPRLDRLYAFSWATAAVVALTATFRAYYILSKILKLVASEEENE
jgi:drug/metabolite transporter (DMT)-like permease